MAKAKEDRVDFEQQLEKLNTIVEQMESGKLSLEDSLAKFEEGIKLTRQCQSALKTAEQKVKLLTEGQGENDLVDFEGIDED